MVRGSFGLSYYQEGLNAFNTYAGGSPGLSQSLTLNAGQVGFTPGSLSVSSTLPALIGFPTDGLTDPLAYLDAMTRTAEYVNRLQRNPS